MKQVLYFVTMSASFSTTFRVRFANNLSQIEHSFVQPISQIKKTKKCACYSIDLQMPLNSQLKKLTQFCLYNKIL